jgi:hypothetical protein
MPHTHQTDSIFEIIKRMRWDLNKMKTTESVVCENSNTMDTHKYHFRRTLLSDVPFPWHLKKPYLYSLLLGKRRIAITTQKASISREKRCTRLVGTLSAPNLHFVHVVVGMQQTPSAS